MPDQNSNWPIIGGIAAALGAGLCCVGPFLLISLGISGAWISNLTQLEPYRPLFIVAVLILFGWAGWQVHRTIDQCEPGSACAIPQTRRRRQIIFWTAMLLATLFVASPYWIPLIAE